MSSPPELRAVEPGAYPRLRRVYPPCDGASVLVTSITRPDGVIQLKWHTVRDDELPRGGSA